MEMQNRRQFIGNLTLGIAASGAAPMALMAQNPEAPSAPAASASQGLATWDRANRDNTNPRYDVLYCFEFGNGFQTITPGFQPVSRVYRNPRYLWISDVRDITRGEESAPLFRNFAQGSEGEFWVGMDDGDYRITLIMADAKEPQGPFAIYLQDQVVEPHMVTSPGHVLVRTFPVNVSQGKLKLRFHAEAGKDFVLNRMIIQGPPGKAAQRIFADAPLDYLPTVEEVLREGNTDAQKTLREYCDWLLGRRLPNGFIGDAARPGPHTHYYWYTSAYPIRTLLAGYDVFQTAAYLDTVVTILDKLVEEQLPNGAWQQVFRDKPTREMTTAETDAILKHRWVNTADIGSIVTALAVSCRYVMPARKQAYLEAARRYCDHWAAKWQLPSGAFTNGLEGGVPQTEAYSVATGTEAAAFAAVYAITREPQYLQRAQRAAEFLLDNWQPDGRPICHQDPSGNMGTKYVQPVTQFGDVLYYHDGILFVCHQTSDPKFREKVRTVYGWHINGERGLLNNLQSNPWWPLQDTWDNSKSAGMPQVLLAYRRMGKDAAVERAVGLMQRFLCTPKFAQRIGVMVNHPDLPWGGDSLQSWAGCAVAATGFGGMSLAEMIKPGMMYLS
jgi:hypothetical protein